MKQLNILLFVIFACFFQANINAQITEEDSTKVSWDWYHIVKVDGKEYIGQILSDDGREVLIYTRELGKIYIPKSEIKSMQKIDNENDIVAGEYRGAGPFTTRQYFTNNAFSVKKGENYAMVHLWGPEVHFAVTDKLSLGVMTTWIGSPLAMAGKYSFDTKNPKLKVSAGTILGTSGYLNQGRGFGGLHFGNLTYGTRLSNITLSAGFGYMKIGDGYSMVYEDNYSVIYNNNESIPYPTATEKKEKPRTGFLFGISGITKVGTKSSFIFDLIGNVSKPQISYYEITRLSEDYYDPNTNTYIWGQSKIETVNTNSPRTTLIFMPGMRFQKSDTKAFQVAIAGVFLIEDGEAQTFPLPMCSWLFKF